MITYEGQGDLFTSSLQTLVCPVNCRGAMGAGLALAFKQRFPRLFVSYWSALEQSQLTTRKPYLYAIPGVDKAVLCFATKDDWKNPSDLSFIKAGLQYVAQYYTKMGITSIAIPPLGCGLGQLRYDEVRPLLYQYLDKLPIEAHIVTGPDDS